MLDARITASMLAACDACELSGMSEDTGASIQLWMRVPVWRSRSARRTSRSSKPQSMKLRHPRSAREHATLSVWLASRQLWRRVAPRRRSALAKRGDICAAMISR